MGRGGEALAETCLLAKGYRLIERRFRVRNGEIDLVMSDRGTIVFVEVRRRRTSSLGDPLESIGPLKRARIVRTARLFLASRRAHDCPCRFDVVAVRDREGEPPEIDHRIDAFRADG